jgi:hypothetical protein
LFESNGWRFIEVLRELPNAKSGRSESNSNSNSNSNSIDGREDAFVDVPDNLACPIGKTVREKRKKNKKIQYIYIYIYISIYIYSAIYI